MNNMSGNVVDIFLFCKKLGLGVHYAQLVLKDRALVKRISGTSDNGDDNLAAKEPKMLLNLGRRGSLSDRFFF